MNQNLLKEVYEKRKPVDQNPNNGRSLPPWLQKAKDRAGGGGDEKAAARRQAIQKRLSKVPAQKGK